METDIYSVEGATAGGLGRVEMSNGTSDGTTRLKCRMGAAQLLGQT